LIPEGLQTFVKDGVRACIKNVLLISVFWLHWSL
jgi:hypothetical protein